jgi:hypothetical protein
MKFSKTKALVLIICVLLIANIVELSFLFTKKCEPPKDKKTIISEFLQNEIGFSADQLKQYDSLRDVHQAQIKTAKDEMMNQKEEDFKYLCSVGFTDSSMHAVSQHSVETQQQLELQLLELGKETRQLCTPSQQAKFDTTFYKVFRKKD